jgi:undecaprenyl-diphosphatase
MDLLHAVLLAILQGFTEFLPISSSGHLILAPRFLDWPDQGLAFDVAVHLGTLLAVIVYFRAELTAMAGAWFRSVAGGVGSQDSRMAWAVIWGTVPVAIAGFFVAGPVESYLRSPMLVASTTAGFGLLLWLADARGSRKRDEYSLGWSDVMIIGLIQVLALVPGTSRSGITMTAGLLLGLTREASARFCPFCHRADELGAEDLLIVLEGLDAFRRPARLEDFLAACEADLRAAPGAGEAGFAQAGVLMVAFEAAAAIRPVTDGTTPGHRIGRRLREDRLRALEEIVSERTQPK